MHFDTKFCHLAHCDIMRKNKLEKLYQFKPDQVNYVLKCLGALFIRYTSFQKCQQT